MEDLELLEPVFGVASGKVEGRESSAFLPLAFRLRARDARTLDFVVSDFHDNTWEATRSIQQLEDLRDEVGIGGAWSEFVSYIGAAFSSGNVTLVLGGPASALAGRGATSGRIVALKAKGMPRVSIGLVRATDASDRMADIAVDACSSWRSLLKSLANEKAEAARCRMELEAEKLKTSMLEEKLDEMNPGGKKKKANSKELAMASQSSSGTNQATGGEVERTKAKTKRKVAPISSRSKRKGAKLEDDD
ncbi:uncharacterized protein LOC9638243 [Selaginella moellendorffii]|uniref:uncharacterized protein LOC9638243 n=1 Tax=Selaginella moellendorffii TaxID=88036 RepID=UPI000D1CAD1F|nr:uncharacterized protein LOC9638243 [Selaginella moellendorffii]XP_024534085.1 uncharacterized protein LOC9638243 [Selaginella moellendorffii]XP_024534086.1 uncharacterized protein LOC9638243 [Selaginella moellendorffii]|eukprot:XP_024534084.1 uncharacterized protein LOC9638243 [Selaginella moellendorffii]